MRATTTALCLGFALGLLLSSSPAEARPPSELVLLRQVNGEFTTVAGEDGGGGLVLNGSTNVASVPVTAGAIYYVECAWDGGSAYVCSASTDSGCSATHTDRNRGVFVQAGQVGRYFILQDSHGASGRLYATGDTTTAFTCPVMKME